MCSYFSTESSQKAIKSKLTPLLGWIRRSMNNPNIRKMVCDNLSYLGVSIDGYANEACGEEVKISTDDSKVDVYVVPTNEELAICQETVKLVEN